MGDRSAENETYRNVILLVSIVSIVLLSGAPTAIAQPFGSFAATGSLNVGRNAHRGVELDNGTVLLAGGYDVNENALASSELYNSATGLFTLSGNLKTARRNFGIALLNDGSVLAAGGYDANFNVLTSAEIYDPSSGTFSGTGPLLTGRFDATATVLNDGTVLVAGGSDAASKPLSSAELYVPSSGRFVQTGSLNTARSLASATTLNDGTVLICGGWAITNALFSCEIYNPGTGSFTLTSNMSVGRLRQSATLLNGGKVLIAGGEDTSSRILSSAELYDPTTGTFASTGALNTARGDHAATLLTNGTVLVEGGFECNPSDCQASEVDMTSSAEIYDPTTGVFSRTGNLATARQVHTATLLSNGAALVAGGWSDSDSGLTSAETYQPGYLTPPNLVSISVSPASSLLSVGSAQRLAAIGHFSDGSMQMLASVVWISSDASVAIVSNASGSNGSIDGDSGNPGVVFGSSSGTATISACAGTLCGSTTLNVVSGVSGLALSVLPGVRIIDVGQPASFVVSLMPQVNFNGTVALSCAGAPQGTSCEISPSTLSVNNLGRVTATLTIARTAQSISRENLRTFRFVVLCSATFCLSVVAVRIRRKAFLLLIAILFSFQIIACNAGSFADITQPGSYVITVTAKAATARGQTDFGLIIN